MDSKIRYTLDSITDNGREEYESISKFKNSFNIKEILTEQAIKKLEKIKNYDNNFICQICKKEIINPSYLNYFQLYASVDQKRFATFHLNCALKEGKADNFNELSNNFDFIYQIKKSYR